MNNRLVYLIVVLFSSGTLFLSPLSAQILPYRNSALKVEDRVNDLLSRMTIEEKVRQMLKLDLADLKQDEKGNITRESLEKLFQGESIGCLDPVIADIDRIARFSEAADQYLRKNTRLGIPAIQVDLGGIHGQLAHGATNFPQSIGQGSTWNPGLIKKMAEVIAYEAGLTGCDQLFAPLFDVGRDPRYGRIEECFGEDPYLVAEMGKAFVIGLQGDPKITKAYIPEGHLISTAKHYVAYSTPSAGINIAPVEVGPRDLRSLHLYPFEKAVREANVYAVMPAYNEVNGIPVHANGYLLKDILRKEYGFKGYVFADYGAVSMLQTFHKITGSKKEAAILALKAGVDQEGADYAYSELIALAKNDKEIAGLVDEAVKNILTVKFRAGLFDKPYFVPKRLSDLVHTKASVRLAREIAEESVVLLKNQDNLLPLRLPQLKSIAVIGPNANQVQYGDYSISKENSTGVTVLEGIKNITKGKIRVNYARGCGITSLDSSGFKEAVDAAQNSDVVVLVIGGSSMSLSGVGWGELADQGGYPTCGEGYDRSELTPPGIQPELIRAISKTGKPVILVMVHGRPYSIPWEKEHIPAILDAWYPGEEGGNAVARILFGEVVPSGKLTVSVPRSAGHLPVFYNYKPSGRGIYHKPGAPGNPGRDYVFSPTDPLFPFGFGLSYTQFEYSDLKIKQKRWKETDTIELTVQVKNTGSVAGKEVVQVYINDKISSVTTPVKVLKGFKKIEIHPSKTATLSFSIPCNELGLWDKDMNYTIEPGEFEIMIGASAEDIRLKDTIHITNT
ncbi:glycoside hydrolase family 3 N-terminal domain-containing protein [Agriterribacter sp.]|jgi:beta-glucosidase|uniref:glycoside hydrolase family 3 N-terminal domain-containing protein n=1 Tax=Agriterribacter sp. TaxID=2821509 RepID=UPI002CBD641B|nr:glycoside hydrolase family 3 N-terminal domain-containing protein [Agriterribacter sp.]HRO47147.1 glycoside hydrolase family 3 N-terminal domain-containing protein [Agriterribacter sp.]HRQ17903.1 glycoside hydrolase family 3 N-terminal domain-containing protein [Agriterribacter sp.]